VLDNTSPYSILEYKAPSGTSANATFVTTYTGAIGIALAASSGSTNYGQQVGAFLTGP
jgi:hypothetical protein